MSGRNDRRRRLLLGTAVLFGLVALAAAGCSGSRRGAVPPPEAGREPSADNAAAALSEIIPPAIPIIEEPAAPPKAETPSVPAASPPVPRDEPPELPKAAEAPPPPPRQEAPPEIPPAEKQLPRAPLEAPAAKKPRAAAPPQPAAPPEPSAPPEPAVPPEPVAPARPEGQTVPAWARYNEVLAYRVEFLGITMGYGRFTYRGKVSIGGKTAYHVNVRAWTTGVLSYIYPINETIDYYLDTGTLEPIRQEFTGRVNKRDDVAIYHQETGKIVYRYRDNGEIRKQVDGVPGIHDSVSAVYSFRWRDMGVGDKVRNVYGGRKIYQISTRVTGSERLRTDRGEVETLVIQPVIRRNGKLENKGDLRMWITNDERRVPVRLYAKFRKIRDWTLIGELLPVGAGG